MRPHLAALLACGCGSAAPATAPIHNAQETESRTRPTLEEVRDAVGALKSAAPYLQDQPVDTAAALAILGSPLWFDGLHYSDLKQLPPCTATSGTLYSSAERKQFAECMVIADWHFQIPAGLEAVEAAEIPAVFAPHRARLGDLARDHLFAVTHFCPAAPGDYWTLIAASKDARGHVRIDAILVHNNEEGECLGVDGTPMK